MLKTRIVSAIVMIAVLAAVLFWSSARIWQWATVALVLLAAWEWARLAGLVKPWTQWSYALVIAAMTAWGMHQDVSDALPRWLTLLWLFVIPFILYQYARSEGRWHFKSPLPLLLLGFVVLFPFAWALFHALLRFGPEVVLWWMVLVWLADSGAYFAGRALGRRKLAPAISPGKTWEGVIGGATAALLGAWLGAWWLAQKGVPDFFNGPFFWLGLIAAFSVIGDLFESVLKRWAGMKDSSQLIPGHGGVLDRIDSLLFALPWMWVVAMESVA
ncbi:phosphatidate cytidylyltransferase [Sulfurivirga caldicuralii]|uniref:Phosphatidate cytidylyltransferase n=1 Tax=Sulfurivirga caldicuralii TaxID=364032 RepID=A0A1N6E0G5_9GAMM|nr:phosphatidate cytidylyltransferase [Sulfurivirga caldicuralii]SIN76481.1 phosphatidate cytidylyltransferase [Sulfurivirga caldicuralii]